MLTAPIVELCPHTVTARGVMKLSHPVIATLAGAVHDNLEWIALLIGSRSEDGLTVTVDSLQVPLQERSVGACSLVRQEPLTPDVVGVVHSHHRMGAFFSTTDDTTLNTRFPTSIVVAQNKLTTSPQEALFGFDYKTEGRVVLPCGSVGVIDFIAIPDPLVEFWPELPPLGFSPPALNVTLSECPHANKELQGLQYHCHTKCGIDAVEAATTIFGMDSKPFMAEVKEKTRGGYHGQGLVVDNRQWFKKQHKKDRWEDEGYLTSWGTGY